MDELLKREFAELECALKINGLRMKYTHTNTEEVILTSPEVLNPACHFNNLAHFKILFLN